MFVLLWSTPLYTPTNLTVFNQHVHNSNMKTQHSLFTFSLPMKKIGVNPDPICATEPAAVL